MVEPCHALTEWATSSLLNAISREFDEVACRSHEHTRPLHTKVELNGSVLERLNKLAVVKWVARKDGWNHSQKGRLDPYELSPKLLLLEVERDIRATHEPFGEYGTLKDDQSCPCLERLPFDDYSMEVMWVEVEEFEDHDL